MKENTSGGLPRPLDLATDFALAVAKLREHSRASALSAAQEANLGYFETMAAVEDAVHAAGTGEDAEPAPAAIENAAKELAEAGRVFSGQARPAEEALAGYQTARVLVRAKSRAELHREAARHLRNAIGILDTAAHPVLAYEAFVLLGEILHKLASAPDETDRETQLGRALACARAAEFLGDIDGDLRRRARHKRLTAMILADRFLPYRDENLLDAIATAGEALPIYEDDSARDPLEYATLQLTVGNAWLKVTRDRANAMKHACDAFENGLAAIDPASLPRLAGTLSGNLAMTRQLITADDRLLPEKEMVGRFDGRIRRSVDAGRILEAIQSAWGFMDWAWGMSTTPNIHVGAAHKILAGLYVKNGDMTNAEMHLYSSVAIFSAVLKPGQPNFSLLERTREDLQQFFSAIGQEEKTVAALAQAAKAVATADALVRRGAGRMENTPDDAQADFEAALLILPTSPNALFYRGTMHMLTGRHGPAQADFSTALVFRPRHIPSLGNRFTVRLHLGDRDGALADCDAILEIDPDHDGALYNRAELRSARKDWDGAIADLDRFLKIHPDNARALLLRAAAKEQKGNVAGSIADLEDVLGSTTDPADREKLRAKITGLREG